jgi:hypothetical protein
VDYWLLDIVIRSAITLYNLEIFMQFKVSVTIFHVKDRVIPLWNKVHVSLHGDKRDLINLQDQLADLKGDINSDMNKRGIPLRDVDIFIDFLD